LRLLQWLLVLLRLPGRADVAVRPLLLLVLLLPLLPLLQLLRLPLLSPLRLLWYAGTRPTPWVHTVWPASKP
jgi:hypothetical protein